MKEQTQIEPCYYNVRGFEVIDFIEAYSLNFNLGNVIKYIARAGCKPEEDYVTALKKAEWYLTREIRQISPNKAVIES